MRANPIKEILNQVRMSVASHTQQRSYPTRNSVNTSHKSTKLTTIQRGTPMRAAHFRTISNNCKTDKTEQTVPGARTAGVVTATGKAVNLARGMNDNFLFLRKENHLNTHFNIRKNKLKEITKANKNIYQRLNTQKSFYSNSDLNKSYESTKQIKSRLSQSKLSHRLNSSQSSSRKSLRQGLKVSKKEEVKLQIKARDINKLSNNQANKFRGLFIRDLNTKPENQREVVKFNSYRKNEYPNPNPKIKTSARMSMQPVKETNEGGMLHRVAQLLCEQQPGKQNRARRSSLVIPQSRKLFNF